MTGDPRPLNDHDVVVRRSGLVVESFGAIDVVFDPATTLVRRLNHTASAIWRSAASPRSVGAMVADVLGTRPDDDPAHDDIVGFCRELLAWGLLETVDEEPCT